MAAIFALIGGLLGMFTGRVPTLVGNLAMSHSELGMAYLVWGMGAIAAMQAMRFVMAGVGSSVGLRVVMPLYAMSVLVFEAARGLVGGAGLTEVSGLIACHCATTTSPSAVQTYIDCPTRGRGRLPSVYPGPTEVPGGGGDGY